MSLQINLLYNFIMMNFIRKILSVRYVCYAYLSLGYF